MGSATSRDAAVVELLDGLIRNSVTSRGSSEMNISGGFITFALEANDSSVLTLSGGSVGTTLQAEDAGAVINIIGDDFAVDGQPVPFGLLPSLSGTLTGVLRSGDLLDNEFFHLGASCPTGLCEGRINLLAIPEPSTGLLLTLGLMGLAAGRRPRAL